MKGLPLPNAISASDRKVHRTCLLLGCGLAALSITATPALAQEAVAADSGEIIVTAQRRAEALGDIPMTVNVLTQETLAGAGVNSVRDLANVTTGYQLAQGGSVPQPSIRGVTSLINGSYENNVAIFIDGLYQAVPAAMNIDLPNISNVQVLKGPQGTLYGRNATGGAILIETVTPRDSWEGKAEVTYGRFDDLRVSGYAAGPLSPSIGVMLSGYTRRTDGYFKKASRTVPGATDGNAYPLEQDSVRAKLKLDASDSFRATTSFAFTHTSDPRGVNFAPLENVPALIGALPGGSTRAMELGVEAGDLSSDVEVKQYEGGLTLELDTGLGEIRSITGYTRTYTRTDFDFDGTYIPFSWATSENRESLFQQSLDYVINAVDKLDLVVGANYYNLKFRYSQPNLNYNGPAALGRPYDPTVETPLSQYVIGSDRKFSRTKEAWAVFLDATFHATDQLSITVGGRYSEEQQDVSAIAWGAGGRAAGVLLHPLTERTSNYSKFTPRASVLYKITPDLSVYASYSQGFRSGEWNASIPGNNPAAWFDVDQETIDAFEVGLKGSSAGFRFDVSGFYYDYKNLQVSTTVVLPPPVNSTFVLLQNAPKAKIYGVEANFQYEIMDNLNVRAGATWLHARYGDNFIFNGVGVNPANPQGINVNPDPLKVHRNVAQDQDLSGLQMSRAPNFSAYFGADYLIPDGEGGLRFAVNAKYTDSYVVTNPSVWGPLVAPQFQRKQRFREGNYVLVNASVTWTEPGGNAYVRVWGNNLTDHKYRLHYAGTSTFGTYSPMAEPLTFGGTVGYKFR